MLTCTYRLVDIFFREERLPLEEGWTVPIHETNSSSQQPLKREIQENSMWNLTEGQTSSIALVAGAGDGNSLLINYPDLQ